MKQIINWACAALVLTAGTAQAKDTTAELKEKINAFMLRDVVSQVGKTPIANLYEVVLKDGKIIYTDAAFSYIGTGEVVTTKDKRNITAETRERISKIDFAALPLSNAIKRVNGSGSRVLAIFEDPNCSYCKRLQKELDALDDVTIYIFLVGVLGNDSVAKAKSIWCADDKLAAWNAWISEAKVPAERSCNDVIDANHKLAGEVRLSGTPTIFLENGIRIVGYVSHDKIEAALATVSAKKK